VSTTVAEEASSAEAKAKEARRREKKRSKATTRAMAAAMSNSANNRTELRDSTCEGVNTASEAPVSSDNGGVDAGKSVDYSEMNEAATCIAQRERAPCETVKDSSGKKEGGSVGQRESDSAQGWTDKEKWHQQPPHRKEHSGQRRGEVLVGGSRGHRTGGATNAVMQAGSRQSLEVGKFSQGLANGLQVGMARPASDITNTIVRVPGARPREAELRASGAAGKSKHSQRAWKDAGQHEDDEQAPWALEQAPWVVSSELADDSWPAIGTQVASKARGGGTPQGRLANGGAAERLPKLSSAPENSALHIAGRLVRPELLSSVEAGKAPAGDASLSGPPSMSLEIAAEQMGSLQSQPGLGVPSNKAAVTCESEQLNGSEAAATCFSWQGWSELRQAEQNRSGELFGKLWDEDVQHLRKELCRDDVEVGRVVSSPANLCAHPEKGVSSPFAQPPSVGELEQFIAKESESACETEWRACDEEPRNTSIMSGPGTMPWSSSLTEPWQGAGWQGWQPLRWERHSAGSATRACPGPDFHSILEDETAVAEPSELLPRPDLHSILRHALDEEPSLEARWTDDDEAVCAAPWHVEAASQASLVSWNPLIGSNVVCSDGGSLMSGILGSVSGGSGGLALREPSG
jgi:hypothetical protein